MRPADMHLTPQELESLLFGAADSIASNAYGASAHEAQQHLSGCAICQSVADRYRNVEAALKSLGSRNKWSPKPPMHGTDCPAGEVWARLAVGLIQDESAAGLVAHAAECDWCGPLLNDSMEDLQEDVTSEEQAVLDKLPSASEQWQRELGKKLAAAAHSSDVGPLSVVANGISRKELAGNEKKAAAPKDKEKLAIFSWPRLAWAAMGFALLAAAAWITWLKTREPDVNQLLAQAYTEQRTIALRIPGAKQAPSRIERGPGRSHLNRPTFLLDAESIISQRLDKRPEDQSWLNKKGRAELLDRDYKSAIVTLRRAKDLPNADPSILTDLATAYFERAEAEDQSTDYRTAAELLSEVLQRNPNDDIALFNRAIVYERLFEYSEAIKDWEQHLRLSHDEGWNGEARQHMEQLKNKMK